ncbi:pyridoxal phosphate phosphatase PHOSPHO2 [Neodiprion lecontei]|uniref:Pyridoxal phosphate phosphatase PHOSPHO2 n=1 Tax=Neodiprion lecontei TaxID=441921 RepID=A0A6J0B5V9_NEOLC|nr:pyridoxal phosphate phosphatase PHOSPHO2 [Neodiprion lecontei]
MNQTQLHINKAVIYFKRVISTMSRPLLVAFDFDHTIVNDNTDIVVRKLLPEQKLPESVRGMYRSDGWTAYMQRIFELLHANCINQTQINAAIDNIPAVNGMEDLLERLHKSNCDIIIISDSNSIFIERWLKNKKLSHTISRVFTNPAKYDDNGLLKIEMYHLQDWCELSTKNLCKGHILQNYIKESLENGTSFERVAYVGDGRNDFCPILRLSEKDFAFPRSNYPLIKILNEAKTNGTHQVTAHICPWNDGTHILEKLLVSLE